MQKDIDINNNITISAGLVIIKNNKILLVHPTNAPWWKSYSIPKGHVREGEKLLDCAIRETKEETGLIINKDNINDKYDVINYDNEKGEIYKRVYYFIVYDDSINESDIKLQLSEVDWAGFLSKKDANKRIFGRFNKILNILK